jgi:hypothetical protein
MTGPEHLRVQHRRTPIGHHQGIGGTCVESADDGAEIPRRLEAVGHQHQSLLGEEQILRFPLLW